MTLTQTPVATVYKDLSAPSRPWCADLTGLITVRKYSYHYKTKASLVQHLTAVMADVVIVRGTDTNKTIGHYLLPSVSR